MAIKKKVLEVLTVVHLGNYDETTGAIINDACPCCGWEPPLDIESEESTTDVKEPEWHLGEIWSPRVERGMGSYFQVFHCPKCGLVYATHLN